MEGHISHYKVLWPFTWDKIPWKRVCIVWFIYLLLSLQRGEEREKEKENTSMWDRNIDQLSLVRTPSRDWPLNLGVFPDWESNWWPFASWDDAQPTEPHHSRLCTVLNETLPSLFPDSKLYVGFCSNSLHLHPSACGVNPLLFHCYLKSCLLIHCFPSQITSLYLNYRIASFF